MSAPLEHTDSLLEIIEERAGAVTKDLAAVLERVRARLLAYGADPSKLTPGQLAAIVDEVLAEMAVAARRARAALGAGSVAAVGELLADKRKRVSLFARMLGDRPSPARVLMLLRAAAALGTGLTGMISDKAVAEQTAERLEQRRRSEVAMWVPERDACARCLRYAGLRILRPGDGFPAGLSYDPAQATTDAGTITGPPLHPHCRCELQLVPRGGSELASQALQREAERAIMKGWALASESQKSRRRAAAALLEQRTILAPVSVRREAAKRLSEAQGFTRPVPSGNETPAEKAFLRSYSGVYRR